MRIFRIITNKLGAWGRKDTAESQAAPSDSAENTNDLDAGTSAVIDHLNEVLAGSELQKSKDGNCPTAQAVEKAIALGKEHLETIKRDIKENQERADDYLKKQNEAYALCKMAVDEANDAGQDLSPIAGQLVQTLDALPGDNDALLREIGCKLSQEDIARLLEETALSIPDIKKNDLTHTCEQWFLRADAFLGARSQDQAPSESDQKPEGLKTLKGEIQEHLKTLKTLIEQNSTNIREAIAYKHKCEAEMRRKAAIEEYKHYLPSIVKAFQARQETLTSSFDGADEKPDIQQLEQWARENLKDRVSLETTKNIRECILAVKAGNITADMVFSALTVLAGAGYDYYTAENGVKVDKRETFEEAAQEAHMPIALVPKSYKGNATHRMSNNKNVHKSVWFHWDSRERLIVVEQLPHNTNG